jgi:hypothetical protein
VGAMTGSQMFVVALGLLGGLIQARFIAPGILGYYAAFAILGGYLTFLHLGLLTALGREYPYWLGKGDIGRAHLAASLVQGWVLLVSAFIAVLYGVIVLVSLALGDYRAAGGWGTQLLVMSLFFYNLYLGCTYRSNSDFVSLSKTSVLGALASFACLPFVAFFGFWGLCVRGSVTSVATVALLHRCRPLHIAPRLAWRPMWDLVKFGLPVDLAGFLANSCTYATMSAVLASVYGVEVLGLFAFARVAESGIQQFTVSMTQVFIPKINLRMGATGDFSDCAVFSTKLTLVGTAVVAGATLIAVLVCGPLVAWLTPKYVAAVPAMRVLMWAGVAPMLTLPGHALMAVRYIKPMVVGSVTGFLIFCGVAGAAIVFELSPLAVAWGYVGAKYASVIVLWVFLLIRMRHHGRGVTA